MQHESNNRLAGRTALVTGAGSPIGHAVCERFAREGAWIVAVDGDFEAAQATAEAARAARTPAIGLKTEALDPTITEHIVSTAIDRMWQVDILVNVTTPIPDTSLKGVVDWAATMAVNLEASFRFARAVLPQMSARDTGVIINTGWCWGEVATEGAELAQHTSEAAVQALTARLTEDHGHEGVRFHTASPVMSDDDTETDPESLANGGALPIAATATPEYVADRITALAALQDPPPASRRAAGMRRE